MILLLKSKEFLILAWITRVADASHLLRSTLGNANVISIYKAAAALWYVCRGFLGAETQFRRAEMFQTCAILNTYLVSSQFCGCFEWDIRRHWLVCSLRNEAEGSEEL